MSKHVITKSEAVKELDRRALPKSDPARRVWPRKEITQASGETLRAIAGTQAPAPKKAPKAERTAVQHKHTELRAEAFAWRLAEYHAGRKHTLAQAYAKYGTAAATVTNDPEFKDDIVPQA